IASTTASADGSPKCSGTRRWRAVAGPRPSSPRSAAPTAASPMWRPPPQSPDSGPSAGKRAWAPPGPTPAQFMPAPTTTTTPQVRSVPARSTANTSLRSRLARAQRRRAISGSSRASSAGRSRPARHQTPTWASGRSAGSSPPASRQAAAISASSASIAPWSPSAWCDAPGPRAAPSTSPLAATSAASVLELPPSTARIAISATGASLRLCWENKETFLTKANLGIIAATVCRARGARMGLKIAVVGAGSTYTPELVEGFAARSERLPMDELVLLDPDEQRLEVVGGLARRMLARAGLGGRLELTGRLEEALDGADFVIVQLRVGGQAQRRIDETLPLEFGCIGQETTGPGGFAKALRTVPVVLDITNPVGIVTQALLDQGHRAIGLCNVAIGFQRRLAAQLVVEPHRVELGHVGLNHLSWLRAVRVDGVDRLPELLAEHAEALAAEVELPVELLRLLGAIPSSYLRYYYLTGEVLDEQRRGPSRAEQVAEIELELLRLYRDPARDTKPALLERRGGAFYSEAAAQLVASLHAGTGDLQVVDVRNDGAIPDLTDDAVVEVPARVDAAGAHPLPQDPLPPELLGLVQQMKAYERLTVAAARGGDRALALEALLANPLVADYRVAVPLLDALLRASRGHLPRFFPG